jgi:hypothetical protein
MSDFEKVETTTLCRWLVILAGMDREEPMQTAALEITEELERRAGYASQI